MPLTMLSSGAVMTMGGFLRKLPNVTIQPSEMALKYYKKVDIHVTLLQASLSGGIYLCTFLQFLFLEY